MEDASTSLKIPKSKCPDIWMHPSKQKWPKSIVQFGRSSRSSRKEFVRSLSGRSMSDNVYLLTKQKTILICACGRHQNGRKTTNMKQNWKIMLKGVDVGGQASFFDDGRHSRSCSLGFGDGSVLFRTSLFGSSHFAQTGCDTVSRSVSLHDVVSCLAKDGLLLKLPQDGSESFVVRVQRRCSGQGIRLRLLARKPQVQRRWQRGQGTHARRCSGWTAPSKFWVTASQQKPGGWRQHFEVEECQGFIQRSQSSEERAAEQKELDAAQVRLTRLREKMMRASSPEPYPTLAEVHQLRARVAEMEAERQEFRKKHARSHVPSPDMPWASEQSVVLFQHGKGQICCGHVDRSSNRYSPVV